MGHFSIDIFLKLAQQIKDDKAVMPRRSDSDKEYFAQDWFANSLKDDYLLTLQGRNSHPDYILTKDGQIEGAELKSLGNTHPGKRDPSVAPCRTDVDFNSSIPCGLIPYKGEQMKTYYYFILYENVGDKSNLTTKAISMAVIDGDYLNNDVGLVKGHLNISESGFGSYGDGFVRTRKMYRFPNPLTESDFRYKTIFISQEADLDKKYSNLELYREKVKTTKDGTESKFYTYSLKGTIKEKVIL